jgi:two-component system, chemotaxis family, sensor kinase CheA
VLLVDDSSAMRSALGGFLRASGMDVVDAASGEAALGELRVPHQTRKFDAVVTDMEMAGMDGIAVIGAVRKDHPDLPVFVWTYHDDPELGARVRKAGARACVNKLHREQLVEAMEAEGVLQHRRQTDGRSIR